ncbi:MAG: DNA topology modulation protein [Chloroflexi bacterium]|nr:DNA topology modulation protein [Chloroflexota bacterium]
MQRVAVVGSAGAGKSTLARQLGDVLGLPVIHLDTVHWQPGWVEPSREEWRATVERIVQGERWVIDGNYGGTMGLRFAAADAIVFLDLPRRLCLWRVVKRRLQFRGKQRPDMAPGCPEKLDLGFLRWIWAYPTASRPEVLRLMEEASHGRRIYRLRSRKEVARFLAAASNLRAEA